jgi:hypothetical protein
LKISEFLEEASMRLQMKHLVAVRRVRKGGSSRQEVVVWLGKPRKVSREEWVCPYHVSGTWIKKSQYAHGIDSFQALLLALEGIRVVLEKSGKQLEWAGGELGDHGFPRFVPTFYGLRFVRRLNRLIDREVARFARVAKARSRQRHLNS